MLATQARQLAIVIRAYLMAREQDADRRRHMLDLAKDLRQCNGRQTQPTNWHALTSRNFSKSLGWSVEHGRAANKHDTAKIRFRSIS
jgi:hypothetical protein